MLQTICVLYKNAEAEMSTLLFWQHIFSLVTLPILLWVLLQVIAVFTPDTAHLEPSPGAVPPPTGS